MSELAVYVATHRPAPVPADPHYRLIQAGAALHPRLDMPGDDGGDSISSRNAHYSELTAHYWIWKNSPARAVGLVHYRRFLAPAGRSFTYNGAAVASGEDLLDALGRYDLLAVEPVVMYHADGLVPRSLEQQYVNDHHGFDLILTRRVVAELHPAYLPAFDFVMRNNRLIGFNMLVARRDVFDAYSAWLFGICFALETLIPLRSLDPYQGRVIGFLSERLFTVWVAHNRASVVPAFRNLVFCPVPDAAAPDAGAVDPGDGRRHAPADLLEHADMSPRP